MSSGTFVDASTSRFHQNDDLNLLLKLATKSFGENNEPIIVYRAKEVDSLEQFGYHIVTDSEHFSGGEV
jgi:hypothetical protein